MEIRKASVKRQLAIVAALMAAGVALRLAPHLPNFAPVGAIALTGGIILSWRFAVWLPLATMMLSDLIIGTYNGIEFTWAGFLLVALFGTRLQNARFAARVAVGAPLGALIFFIVSNFGVWLTSGMYAPTLQGLLQCYYLGLPFFRTSVAADIFYSFILLGAYEIVRARITVRQSKTRLELKHQTTM